MHKSVHKSSENSEIPGKDRKAFLVLLMSLAALVVFGICLVRAIVVSYQDSTTLFHVDSEEYESMKSWNEGWTLEYDGQIIENITLPCTLDEVDGEEVKISRNLTEEKIPEVLEFDNLRQSILVTSDAGDLCRVNMTKIAEGMIFTDLQIVELPKEGQATELSLIFKTGDDGSCTLPSISCGSMAAARYDILDHDMSTLALLGMFVLLIIILVVTGIWYSIKDKTDPRIWILAIFLFFVAIWGLTDSYLPTMFCIHQEILGILTYMSLMAMPVPIGAFVWLSYGKKSRSLPLLMVLDAVNMILEGILSIFGIVQLHKTFLAGHVFDFVVVGFSMAAIIKEQRGRKRNAEENLIFLAFVIQALTCSCAVLTYWFIGGSLYVNVMLAGTLLFVCTLFTYVITHTVLLRRQEDLRHSEEVISERLSHYDPLSGLLNRRAYEKKMEEIDKTWDKDAVLVMIDVNGLKMTNDIYGNAAGDDLIVSAARVISGIYGEENCYRIGGDEFSVILTDLSKSIVTYEEELERTVEKENQGTVWKLSFALGSSYLINPSGRRLSISDWKLEADVKMYQNKIAISNKNYRNKAKDLSDIIDCIITTLEAKDSYTAYHSDRVREISVCIGSKLGLSDNTLEILETAAHMHDIGKVGVPDRVLTKPGALTDEEYALMKRHSAIGAEILSKAKGMKDIANIVLHHHERYDGRGYPDGIAGDEIPLESRIIAIADSIDAMTSKRVYRETMSIDECRREIERNQGVMYDPAICRIVLENWTDIQNIILTHPKRLGN